MTDAAPRGRRSWRRRSYAVLTTFVALLARPAISAAQAWVPPAGSGAVSLGFQIIDNSGHRLTDGSLLDDGKSSNAGVALEVEYAFTDRFSMAAGIPYVSSKYRGPGPTPFVFLPVDSCMCWHSGWQDFSFAARYNLIGGAFSLTPSVVFGIPSHSYDFRGEATLGADLKELRLGVDVGQRLDAISPRLSVQGRYTYAIVEQPIDIAHNRSNATFEGGYAATRKLAVRGLVSVQRTHGGLRLGSLPPSDLPLPGEVNSLERQVQHDRLLRDNNWRVGAAASYSLQRVDLFTSYIQYVHGTDSHAGHVVTAGISWPFEIALR